MKFVPRKARDDVNVSPEHPLVEATTLVVGLGLLFLVVMVALIFLAELLLFFVPPEKEIRMFDAWLPENIATVAVDDPRLEKLEVLLANLSRHWPEAAYPFRIEIDDAAEPNAMAYPGGLIVVTSGLVGQAETENELAFILGHELGHFHNRDHIRGLGRGAVIAILFAAIRSSDNSAALGSSIANLTLSGFSRGQEARADRFGLELVHAEYGHVADAWQFFSRIDDGDQGRLQGYLSTHPAPRNRIDRLRDHARDQGWSADGTATPLDWPAEPAGQEKTPPSFDDGVEPVGQAQRGTT